MILPVRKICLLLALLAAWPLVAAADIPPAAELAARPTEVRVLTDFFVRMNVSQVASTTWRCTTG